MFVNGKQDSGYSNPKDAISKYVDEEDKGVAKCDTQLITIAFMNF